MSNISTNLAGWGEKRVHLSVCQSTNDEIHGRLLAENEGLKEGFLVSTDFQTAGRGQKGNRWESKPGENLMFSFLLEPTFLPARHAFWLSACVALGIADALEKYIPQSKVKWPNDLMVNGLKIGGILIENVVSGQNLDRSVVGIGLNINQTELLPTATSLQKERHISFDTEIILKEILDQIRLSYFQLQSAGWEKMRQQYYKKLYKMAIPHDYQLPDGRQFRAVLKGISENGELILIASDGEKRFSFKEVGF